MNQEIDTKKILELANRTYNKTNSDEPVEVYALGPKVLARYGAEDGFFTTSDTTFSKESSEPGTYANHEIDIAADLTMESLSDDLAGYSNELAQAIYNEYCRRDLKIIDGGAIAAQCRHCVQYYDDKLRELRDNGGIPELGELAQTHEYVVSLVIENLYMGNAWIMRAALVYHYGPVGQYATDSRKCQQHTVFIPAMSKGA